MACFDWLKRTTPNFGDTLVPVAELILKDTDGQSHRIAVAIDTGAVITLLRRSVADLLGVDWESGAPVSLRSVGGAETRARRHDLSAQIDGINLPLPVAIAENETVPNLLGRLGVIDRFRLELDPSLKSTEVQAKAWPDDVARIWKFFAAATGQIAKRIGSRMQKSDVDEASRIFFDTAMQRMVSFSRLTRAGTIWDCPILLRAMFDLAIQYEWLMQDAATRAKLYLDYEHVTRYLHTRAITEVPRGPIAAAIASSPLRADGEPRVKREFERVRHAYQNKKGRLRKRWYPGNLWLLAKELGREGEYVLVNRWWNRFVHADPSVLRERSDLPAHQYLNFGLYLTSRIVLICANHYQVILTNEEYEVLKTMADSRLE